MAVRARAWRFEIPQRVATGRTVRWDSGGLQITPGGRIAMVEDDDAVRQSIQMLIATVPGERVMRPEYGCELHRLLFAPNDDTTAGLAIHYVRQAIERWEPRIDIVSIDAQRDATDPGRLEIYLSYSVRATAASSQLTIPLDLQEPAA